jgi:predicted nuclease with RNAse H fold
MGLTTPNRSGEHTAPRCARKENRSGRFPARSSSSPRWIAQGAAVPAQDGPTRASGNRHRSGLASKSPAGATPDEHARTIYGECMFTVGVDLAAEPAGTAVATIAWSAGRAWVRGLVVGADDDAVVAAIDGADKVGIDCPLGWPVAFVEFVSAHHEGHVTAPDDVAGRDWRRRLAYRVTDEVVRETVGRWPLSVSADRIGHTAMRTAGLLARLARNGHPVDRSGAGVVVEVYPAASLRMWGLPYRGYKGKQNRPQLAELVDRLQSAVDWLDLGAYQAACRESDHAFDAVVAALTAGAALRGRATLPSPRHADAARTEGWIAVPNSTLDELRP